MKTLVPENDLKNISDSLGKDINKFNGKTILITGAFGFLGSVFISFFQYLNREVLYDPAKIICLDNFIIGCSVDESFKNDPNVEIIHHDICFPIGMKLKRGIKIDFLCNCAGIAAPRSYLAHPISCMDVGYLGTKNMCELAYQHDSNLINFSSSECYGTPPDDQIPTNEKFVGAISTNSDRSMYDYSKLNTQVISNIYFKYHKINVKVVFPFNIYSYVSQNDTRVLPNFIKSVLKKETLKVYAKKNDNTRTFCFVTDAITGFLKVLLLGKPGEWYNIGNDKPEVSMRDLAGIVCEVTNYEKSNIEIVDYPEIYPSTEPARRCPDLTKARNELGYNPTVSLEDGVGKFHEWAKINYKF